FMIELVNTQTSPELASTPTYTPVLDLGGFTSAAPGAPPSTDPYAGGAWDIVFTGDDPYSRPDPHGGQLMPNANLYAATPLNQYSFKPAGGAPTFPPSNNPPGTGTVGDGFNVMLQPLTTNGIPMPPTTPTFPPTDYFYAFGNSPPNSGGATPLPYESGAL